MAGRHLAKGQGKGEDPAQGETHGEIWESPEDVPLPGWGMNMNESTLADQSGLPIPSEIMTLKVCSGWRCQNTKKI